MSQPPPIRPLSTGFSFRVGPAPAPAATPAAAPPGPRPPQAVLDAIGERLAAGDMPGAFAAAEAALAEGYEHPALLNLSAGRLEAEGKPGEALVRLQRARHLAPGDPGVLNALGLCLLNLEAAAEAEAVFRDLIAIVPDFPPAHANLGQALAASGRLDRAGAAYRRALELDPDQMAALAGLAGIAARRGAFEEAERLADKVLERAPDAADALMAKARSEADDGRLDSAEARLRRLVADPRLPGLGTADALNLLGDVLDLKGERLGAFGAWSGGNDILKRHYAHRFAGTGAVEHTRRMDGWIARNPGRLRPPTAPLPPGPARSHVFLLGFPRSGTTLLEAALTGSPDVAALEEQEALVDGVRRYLRDPTDLSALADAGPADLAAFRDAYWKRVREAGQDPDGKVFLDRYPLNSLKLPLILRLFPEATILFALRDPRDVLFSCWRRRFQMSAPMYHLLDLRSAAGFYDAVMTFSMRLEGHSATPWTFVRHESLLADFEGVMQSICMTVGVEWTEAMRDVGGRNAERAIATPSAAQLAGGLRTDGGGAWRPYADRLADPLATLAPWVKRFGYPEA
ncbi:MAG: hypothetical protein RL588_1999 [Pseudomonadota bacterium]|jgi:tetratricopeptide (TPR) repeat protein